MDRALSKALDAALSQFNGSGIWRSPRGQGSGSAAYEALVNAKDGKLNAWKRAALAVLRRHLEPDPRSCPIDQRPVGYRLPVLAPGDRRAFLRAGWSPFLPEAAWLGSVPAKAGTAQVYLDVSGSMDAEMPLLVALLAQLSRHVRRPCWAFSNRVAPAVIEDGQLKASTTGGTSMACVLEHVAKAKPCAAVVVTDGYVGKVDLALVASAAGTRHPAIVSRDGSPAEFRRARIPYTQLGRLPS